jgi:aldehyde:ferredoxin oxidoreductase
METGVALGVLGETDVYDFGDFEKAEALILEIGKGSPMGRLLGSGAMACGQAFGVERVPVVKGQGMAAYDPRVIQGMGVTYSQSPMGADHTAGNAITLSAEHTDPKGKVPLVQDLHINTMVLDSLGMCLFTGRVSLGSPEILTEFLTNYTGYTLTFDELKDIARGVLLKERDFNSQAGFSKTADRLPTFMCSEALPPNNTVFGIEPSELDTFYEFTGA